MLTNKGGLGTIDQDLKVGVVMSAILNINEAKTNFSNVIASVENNLITVTIMRHGRPVAQIVPIERHNRTKPDPRLSQISYTGDLCSNEANAWENA